MALRGLDPKMIVNLCDVVEMNFSKLSTWFEDRLAKKTKKVVPQFETSSDVRVSTR